jgi:hypothetical protein
MPLLLPLLFCCCFWQKAENLFIAFACRLQSQFGMQSNESISLSRAHDFLLRFSGQNRMSSL